MNMFEAVTKKWGYSVGVVIPTDIIQEKKIGIGKKIKLLVVGTNMASVRKTFGSLKIKKPTQQIMDEIDEGYD